MEKIPAKDVYSDPIRFLINLGKRMAEHDAWFSEFSKKQQEVRSAINKNGVKIKTLSGR